MGLKRVLFFASFCLLGFIVDAQVKSADYDARWKAVDSLIQKKGLTQSALNEVNKLSVIARKEKNDPQLIKALVYRLNLEQSRTDSGVLFAIKDLEKELAPGLDQQPARSILECILAKLYIDYLRQHQYTIESRTTTVNFVKTDVATWSVQDLTQKIVAVFRAALADEDVLWRTPVDNYSPIVIKGNTAGLRPTLFDLLAHVALDYFKTGETAQARLLFERLLQRHRADKTPNALIDVEIEQLVFEHQYGDAADKEQRYMNGLRRLTDRYGDLPAAAEAWYLQAQQYADQPGVPKDQRDTLGNRKAIEICEKVIAQPNESEGKQNCSNLLTALQRKELTLTTERVNIPGKPFRALVRWNNLSRLYLRIVRLDWNGAERENVYDSIFWVKLLQLPAVRNWSQDLPDTKDHNPHQTEIAVGSLPPGHYGIVAGTNADWSLKGSAMCLLDLYVTRISWISQDDDYFVLDRQTGQPLAGASVQVWYREDGGKRKQDQKGGSYTADQQGHFRLEKKSRPDSWASTILEVTIPGDRFSTTEPIYRLYSSTEQATGEPEDRREYERRLARCFLFTDRSIYRPGQTVYFKGIEVTKDAGDHKDKPVTGDPVKLFLQDANNQVVDSLSLTTNEFGSYHGAFRLPENRLNGSYTIRMGDNRGSVDFSVEEYKRPKFFVDYDTLKGSYRVGDSIRVTGTAKAYSGNGIDGAKVVYRVTRRARFRYSWLFWRRVMPNSFTEIQHGEIKTDGQGKFSVSFFALPDPKVSPDTKPEYDYEVSADVTDLNGETRSGHASIVAGYTALRLGIDLPAGGQLPTGSLGKIPVTVSNLAGQPVNADVELTMTLLHAPQRLIRARLWEAPDRFVLSEKAFLDSFPHDEYREEGKKESWEKENVTWSTALAVPASGKMDAVVPGPVQQPGWYVLEARTVDKYGQAVVDRQYIQLYDGKTGRTASPQYLWPADDVISADPGMRVSTATGSSDVALNVIRMVERNGGKEYTSFAMNKERKSTEWMVTEADRGGFGVTDIFVRDNRVYTHAMTVRVPWTNKTLNIHYVSFRDKTEPGSAEKWRMTLSGSKGEKVSAEVLTAMYDASLDAFRAHDWTKPDLYPDFGGPAAWSTGQMFTSVRSQGRPFFERWVMGRQYSYDVLLLPGSALTPRYQILHDMNPDIRYKSNERPAMRADAVIERNVTYSGEMYADAKVMKKEDAADYFGSAPTAPPPAQLRKDFRETAFFFPDLSTDSAGNVSFSFTMPEALTSWKWMTLAHTRDLAFGYAEKTVITQKELMVQPNAPRFLREGDRMELPVKVVNLTDSEMTGQVHLALTDPTTGQTADGWFVNRQANQYFTVPAHGSVSVGFPLDIPYQYNRPLTYRVTAEARNYSDGEEATLPVVSNRMLVTESLPLNMPGDGTKHFRFEKLLKSGSSETLNHHALTVEFTANPAWYAVQALPYLMEYPYECAEQVFNRAYANALATRIVSNTPRLREVFEKWRTADTAALLSNLQKNQELKSILSEETPWVLEGKSEEQQKKNIAMLFDLDRMSRELESAVDKLRGMQSTGGGFPWFKGGLDDRYITQYILTGIGRLRQLKAVPPSLDDKLKNIVALALPFLDEQLKREYEELLAARKRAKGPRPISGDWVSPVAIEYLYMRSFFSDAGIPGNVLPAVSFYRKQAQKSWVGLGNYLRGMAALALYRTGDVQTAKDILASLKQNAIRDEEKGMYWKGMETGGYYWYQAPVETEALLIEAFREIGGDAGADRDMKTWLLRQKQTHHWATTKATADACYALMLGGQEWLNAERDVVITLGDKAIDWPAGSGDAGTGYNKKVFDGPFVNPSMGDITVRMTTKGNGSPAWGAVYWQYFDMLDRVTMTGRDKVALSVEKKLFVSRNTDRGPVLEPLADNGSLKPGDKVVVRMVIRADRSMEYVHLKDMRGACFEPVNVLSEYRWQDGLGYYESTRDASTDFFFSWLPKGTHVFEYTLFAGQAGNFSNGVTTIECMYAPEFAFHSEGIHVNVEAAR
ncbi:MAG TPA: alpha-2-macroglobulin family protein [Puia sp.]|uniref:alpha-2-macroglobulin family protein n=1 Tax=Puia sp. TaxID=2045100 RepID=UPI002BEA9C22|nr:alpha-2-macroglobulin family protein [Puia sp.]HVU99372.1 alpha-2-macroglobulin family protein [Puia sp.]